MAIIKHVNAISLAKYSTLFFALFALLLGLLLILIIGTFTPEPLQNTEMTAPSAGDVVILTIIGGVFGFVFGTLGAIIYNALSFLLGGVEIELER
ncbi:MAG: hypothetical protein HC945_02600 [Nitrosarchaeum sp.]|nr:hypothetical protein [Nitrosarchaeum sp.]